MSYDGKEEERKNLASTSSVVHWTAWNVSFLQTAPRKYFGCWLFWNVVKYKYMELRIHYHIIWEKRKLLNSERLLLYVREYKSARANQYTEICQSFGYFLFSLAVKCVIIAEHYPKLWKNKKKTGWKIRWSSLCQRMDSQLTANIESKNCARACFGSEGLWLHFLAQNIRTILQSYW